jgi:hypothetical protein
METLSNECKWAIPLLKKIDILAVGSFDAPADAMYAMLQHHPLFRVHYVATPMEVDAVVTKRSYIHAGVCMLQHDCSEQLRCVLQKKPGIGCAMFYISGRGPVRIGYELAKAGARGVFDMPYSQHERARIIACIRDVFLETLLIPPCGYLYDEVVRTWCGSIRTNVPLSVMHLVREVKVGESYFRKRWKKHFGLKPKVVLTLYALFRYAFEVIEQHQGMQQNPGIRIPHKRLQIMAEYYSRNKKEFDAIVRRDTSHLLSKNKGRDATPADRHE